MFKMLGYTVDILLNSTCNSVKQGAVSSAGRASVLQTGGHRFESYTAHHSLEICSSVAQLVERTTVNRKVAGSSPARGAMFGAIAQLVRASACHAEGREFESR